MQQGGEDGMYGLCRDLHKDQLSLHGCKTATQAPKEEAGAAEGWVTTGSRRLSKETRTRGHPWFVQRHHTLRNSRTGIQISTIPFSP